MENKQFENNKKAGKKTVRLNEISNLNNGDLYYIINKQNKVRLMYMDGGCKI